MPFSPNLVSHGFNGCKNFLEETWERDLCFLHIQPEKINDIAFLPTLCDIASDYVWVNHRRQILNIN